MLEGNTLKAKLVENTSSIGALGFKGERGYSNYEIYVKNGGTLTEEEWLDHFGVDLTNVVKTTDVVNNLSSASTNYPLSAYQGRYLKNYIDTYRDNVIGEAVDLETTSKIVVYAINELKNHLDELNENTNKELNLYKGKNFVVFGDSFSEPGIDNSEDEFWVKQVAQATGMTRFNFAKAGAGFGRSGNILHTQYETAVSTMSTTQKNDTAIVIIYAGYNDMLNSVSSSTIIENCTTLVNDVHTSYPNAKIILVPFNWGYGAITDANNNTINYVITQVSRNLGNMPVVILKLARYWNLGKKTWYRNDGHPNQNGYSNIAHYMIGAIYGSAEHVSWSEEIPLLHGTNKNCNYTFEDGKVNISFYSNFMDTLTSYSGTMNENLPPIVIPEHDVVSPLYTSNGTYIGTIRISTNGIMYIDIVNTLSANTYCFAAPITYNACANSVWSS